MEDVKERTPRSLISRPRADAVPVLTDPIERIESAAEANVRGQLRTKLMTLKAKELLGRGAVAVSDSVMLEGEYRYVWAVDRQRAILDEPRPDTDRMDIARFFVATRQLREENFQKVAEIVSEGSAALAASEFTQYVPPPPPPVQEKKKVLIVKKGGFLKPDVVEEVEV